MLRGQPFAPIIACIRRFGKRNFAPRDWRALPAAQGAQMSEIPSADRTRPRQAAEIPARRSAKELVKTRPIGVSSSVTYQTPAVVLAAQVVDGVVLGTCVQIQHMMTDY
jgi:hypothetical protein